MRQMITGGATRTVMEDLGGLRTVMKDLGGSGRWL